MLAQYGMFRRRVIEAYSVVLLSTTALSVIVFVLPKPEAYASPVRLVMTGTFFVTATAGVAGWLALRRRAADAWLAFRYHGAGAAVTTTVAFLIDERRAASRGVALAFAGAVCFLGLDVVAAWPQCGSLAPFRDAFAPLSAATLGMALLAPFWRRKNIINGLYLRHCLALQARQLNFKPWRPRDARRMAAELTRPAVTNATATGFRAAGFDWTLDDFQKNAIVFGQPGSGKTITVMNTALEGMFATSAASSLPAAGLVIDPKGDFKAKLLSLVDNYDRVSDLLILSASDYERYGGTTSAINYNPLDCDDDALEVAARLATAGKLAGGLKVGDNSYFWDAARSNIRYAVVLLRAAHEGMPPSLLDIKRLATERPEEGQKDSSFYLALSKAVFARYRDSRAMPPATVDAFDYFENEWRCMPDRQKGGVISSVTQLLDDFSVDPFRAMTSGRSTISIGDAIDQGKIIYVDLPIASRPRMATLMTGLIKAEFQREILRRVDKKRPSFLLADEFHLLWNAGEGQGDAEFFALSRQSNHANIVAAQNISSFYKKVTNKDEVRNFLGNCATKIFLRNEAETNAWASQLFGERAEITVGSNENASLDHPVTRGFTSYSRSTTTARVVPPEALAKLAIPLRESRVNQYAEAIVHLAGRDVTQRLDLAWRVNAL